LSDRIQIQLMVQKNCFCRSCSCWRHDCPRFSSAWTKKASF